MTCVPLSCTINNDMPYYSTKVASCKTQLVAPLPDKRIRVKACVEYVFFHPCPIIGHIAAALVLSLALIAPNPEKLIGERIDVLFYSHRHPVQCCLCRSLIVAKSVNEHLDHDTWPGVCAHVMPAIGALDTGRGNSPGHSFSSSAFRS